MPNFPDRWPGGRNRHHHKVWKTGPQTRRKRTDMSKRSRKRRSRKNNSANHGRKPNA